MFKIDMNQEYSNSYLTIYMIFDSLVYFTRCNSIIEVVNVKEMMEKINYSDDALFHLLHMRDVRSKRLIRYLVDKSRLEINHLFIFINYVEWVTALLPFMLTLLSNDDIRSLINVSSERNYVEVIKLLPDVESELDVQGYKPLLRSIESGNLEFTKYVIEQVITDEEKRREVCEDLLTYAVISDSIEIVELLVNNGARSDSSVLSMCCMDNMDMMKWLVHNGLIELSVNESVLLNVAAYKGNIPMLTFISSKIKCQESEYIDICTRLLSEKRYDVFKYVFNNHIKDKDAFNEEWKKLNRDKHVIFNYNTIKWLIDNVKIDPSCILNNVNEKDMRSMHYVLSRMKR